MNAALKKSEEGQKFAILHVYYTGPKGHVIQDYDKRIRVQ